MHDEVLGGKLRGFKKKVGCSEAEALGILTILWLWARKNADMTGFLYNTDREDIANIILPYVKNISTEMIVNALIEEKWIDDIGGQLYIHDWYEWQQYWFRYLDKKENDRLRKRKERERKADENKSEPIVEEQPKNEPKKPASKKEKKPPKTAYGESVKMYPEEYEKLVEQYGEDFTAKLIEELDNYKLAVGKQYKDDYRAILNWVVSKCENKYPQLKKQIQRNGNNENPFADCIEE